MYISERTINNALIGTEKYLESMNVILFVFLNRGFKVLFSKEDKEKAKEKLIVYGYNDFCNKREAVLELYKL